MSIQSPSIYNVSTRLQFFFSLQVEGLQVNNPARKSEQLQTIYLHQLLSCFGETLFKHNKQLYQKFNLQNINKYLVMSVYYYEITRIIINMQRIVFCYFTN